ncbi:hypothetical protein IEQ34_019695 [Dendrobium chrysotoxum]|uniref:Uncharacterized protein n=1 Tax=Dendrobium chrysotoxum TaxID=161865 RepID=A0AAV7G7P9_DENCH|nr:hypothetical protein IEQ34_019695 [Dendrobium chrysotoxum]
MINLGMDTRPSTSVTAEKAISFISKGWREVRDSAGADFQLMRARANSFKDLADREVENFLHSASVFSVPSHSPMNSAIAELEFVKRIQPKLSEFRRAYSSPDFSRKMLEKWNPKPSIRIDLSGIRNAIVSEVDHDGGLFDFESGRPRRLVRRIRWKEREREKEEWEPIRQLKEKFKELEQKSQSNDIFGNFKSKALVEKVKLSLQKHFLAKKKGAFYSNEGYVN